MEQEEHNIEALPSKPVQIQPVHLGQSFTDLYVLCEDGAIYVRRTVDKGGVRIHAKQGWSVLEEATAKKGRGRPRKEETEAAAS